jgi:tetratricopeptide (TPR) repeat protein
MTRAFTGFAARRALVPAPLWIGVPTVGSLVGTARLIVVSFGRIAVIFGLPVGTYAAITKGNVWEILGAFAAWFLVLLGLSIAAARNRVIVGDFEYVSMDKEKKAPAEVDVADLLRGEIARIASLLHVVGDRRAVSSGLTEQTALDATLSVDELNDAFRGAAGEEASLTFGKLTIPLTPFVHLLGKVVASARITGRLHQDGDSLILTAQTSGTRRLAWRVDARRDGRASAGRRAAIVRSAVADGWLEELSTRGASATIGDQPAARNGTDPAPRPPVVAKMVRELALRVYTDLALDEAVRWEASGHFVAGLRSFRSCLRTPKDRKVNLRGAEGEFLEALAEDEDFPLAYYNLGVVYTELFGLASAAGRVTEAAMRRSAAETSFGRAIEKAPQRWDCHFAFAQTQLSYGRRRDAVELCEFMLRRGGLTLAQQARTRELIARALVLPLASVDSEGSDPAADPLPARGSPQRRDHAQRAWREARRASELSLRAVRQARGRRRTWRSAGDERTGRATQLASACILTYGKCYLERVLSQRGLANEPARIRTRARWRMSSVLRLLWRLGDAGPELQHHYGTRALEIKDLASAEPQLREAAGSAPTRPDYAADLALCLGRIRQRERSAQQPEPPVTPAQRAEVLTPALNAIKAMAKTFYPTHGLVACDSLVKVCDELAGLPVAAHPPDAEGMADWDLDTVATAVRSTHEELTRLLEERSSSTSASGVFLQALVVPAGIEACSLVGEYGDAARRAFERLVDGQEKRYDGVYDDSPAGRLAARADERAALKLFERALAQAERATSLNPLSTFAWETLGDIFAEFSDYEHARDAWNQALRTDPDNPHLYGKIGQSHWNIAFQGGARPEPSALERAATEFGSALLLYGSDDRDERILTHYRLSKLNSVLGRPADARRHLQIVVAASERAPVVGCLNFALACLRRGDFSEGEYYFRQVIDDGRELHDTLLAEGNPSPGRTVMGDRLDERLWPLSLVRAWAHVGLVLSWIDRDARKQEAGSELEKAEDLLRGLYGEKDDAVAHERFPTRIRATLAEARARLVALDDRRLDAAIEAFEKAVSQYPYSRTYAGLADALERKADSVQPSDGLRRRAATLVDFAQTLGPPGALPAETLRVKERLSAPVHLNGSAPPVNGEVRPLERWRAAVRRVTAGHLGPS